MRDLNLRKGFFAALVLAIVPLLAGCRPLENRSSIEAARTLAAAMHSRDRLVVARMNHASSGYESTNFLMDRVAPYFQRAQLSAMSFEPRPANVVTVTLPDGNSRIMMSFAFAKEKDGGYYFIGLTSSRVAVAPVRRPAPAVPPAAAPAPERPPVVVIMGTGRSSATTQTTAAAAPTSSAVPTTTAPSTGVPPTPANATATAPKPPANATAPVPAAPVTTTQAPASSTRT